MSPSHAAAVQAPGALPAQRHSQLDHLLRRVEARIAPTWPLDRFIAVNPLWGNIDRPMSEVAAQLAALSGARMLMPRAWFREAYREGRLRDEHLLAAIAVSASERRLADLRELLERDEPAVQTRAQVVDVADADRDLGREPSWRGYIVHHVSQFCASFFDDGQAQLGPDRSLGLYASWRSYAQADQGPALRMGATWYRAHVRASPPNARDLIALALDELEVPPHEQESYLWSLLLDQNGWASWCAYRRWTARLGGLDDDALTDLLAIRVAWEWMLYTHGGAGLPRAWSIARSRWAQVDDAARARADDWLLQSALEIAWREPVLRDLPRGLRAPRPTDASAQAVFCIDVRSEVFRRALEAAAPSVQTLGFAGFFGVPTDYRPLGAPSARPQLPGLLAPRVQASDLGLDVDDGVRRARRLDLAAAWRSFKTDALSTFLFVEALGVPHAGKLLADSLGLRRPARVDRAGLSAEADARRKPRLIGSAEGAPLDLDARCDLALGMLRGMSLTRDFARLVLLAGHGSTARNNPHRAGLDCGACCGQTGEVNARAAASLLNDPGVRSGLARRGVPVPEATWFVAGLHDTTTDDVELFDLDELPATHRADLEALRARLAAAGDGARLERAGRLGLGGVPLSQLHHAIRARSRDWAQVRPEWGLANNAAFIVAPREHCRHLDLEGRAFLHEYRHQEDAGYGVLELVMTAPMVVTHWINAQYYASTVDNLRYGSGNKVLHNVVGGHLGVFEGNGGDLRIGLPLQSLHDGRRWVHTPLRLSVFIEAPREAMDRVLDKHPHVRALVTNGWLALFQIDEDEGAIYALRGGWQRCTSPVDDSGPA